MLRRLRSRLWSTKPRKLLLLTAIFAFTSLILWCVLSEVMVFRLCSVAWRWPVPYPDIHEEAQPEELTTPLPNRVHNILSTTHHYVLGTFNERISRRSRYQHRKGINVNSGLKILIFSDPHIMCTHNKEEWWFARWDADHYLSQSFSYLYPSLRPDLVIFLGDVFSNGFEASQRQWDDYVQCLKSIYPVFNPSEREKLIVTMGDNDLGGEGRDLMTDTANRRYEETFGDLNSVFEIIDGVRIVKITTTCFLRPPVTQTESDCRTALLTFLEKYSKRHNRRKSSTHLTILLTHIPLNDLERSQQFYYNRKAVSIKDKILLTLRPGIVISGHIHHEQYTLHSVDEWSTNEITVPTCSYRMGEASMGVGSLVVSHGGNVAYRVNWLPSRYPFVVGYVVLGVSLLCICMCLVCGHR